MSAVEKEERWVNALCLSVERKAVVAGYDDGDIKHIGCRNREDEGDWSTWCKQ